MAPLDDGNGGPTTHLVALIRAKFLDVPARNLLSSSAPYASTGRVQPPLDDFDMQPTAKHPRPSPAAEDNNSAPHQTATRPSNEPPPKEFSSTSADPAPIASCNNNLSLSAANPVVQQLAAILAQQLLPTLGGGAEGVAQQQQPPQQPPQQQPPQQQPPSGMASAYATPLTNVFSSPLQGGAATATQLPLGASGLPQLPLMPMPHYADVPFPPLPSAMAVPMPTSSATACSSDGRPIPPLPKPHATADARATPLHAAPRVHSEPKWAAAAPPPPPPPRGRRIPHLQSVKCYIPRSYMYSYHTNTRTLASVT